MRVLLAVFPHKQQPRNQHHLCCWAFDRDSFFFWGGWEEEEGKKCRLAWMLYWQGGFPCLAWIAELPHKTWQLLTPTRGCVCLYLFVIYWRLHLAAWSCVFACGASDPPAQDVGLHWRLFACCVCLQVVFCICECSFIIFECILYLMCLACQMWLCVLLWHPPPLQ